MQPTDTKSSGRARVATIGSSVKNAQTKARNAIQVSDSDVEVQEPPLKRQKTTVAEVG